MLPRAVLAGVVRACEMAYPDEACGLLVGRPGADGAVRVSRLEPSPNLALAPAHAFEVDPRLRLMLQRTLRGTPEAVVGLYHSHPDGEARPSETDLKNAWEPELVWLIAAVAGGRLAAVTAHRLDPISGRFRELAVVTTEEDGP